MVCRMVEWFLIWLFGAVACWALAGVSWGFMITGEGDFEHPRPPGKAARIACRALIVLDLAAVSIITLCAIFAIGIPPQAVEDLVLP